MSTATSTGIVQVSSASQGALAAGFQSTLPGAATISFDNPINAFAVDLVDWASSAHNIASGGIHTLSIQTNTGSVNRVLATAPPVRPDQNVIFFGVIDENHFDSLLVSSTTGGDTIGMDDLDYGSVASVPEPCSAWMLCIPSLLLACRSRRR